ncbi:MAG: dUTP diphosphatase [Bdellovibrionales bacterium]|nr:dUTP diphosphatase [Bdellovibrionales bacterium]
MDLEFLKKTVSKKQNFYTKKVVLKVKKLPHFKGDLPSYQSESASGFDVQAQLKSPLYLKSLERTMIPTGLIFEIPNGFELQVRPRSGLSLKKGLSIPNSPGTIDSDYRGELKIIVVNLSSKIVVIENQQRIAQVVLSPVFQAQLQWADKLSSTQRGAGGFGSTGV